MKKLLIPAMLIASMALGTSCGSDSSTSPETNDSIGAASDTGTTSQMSPATDTANSQTNKDHDFALEAASGGLMEVELGKLAATNASSAEVKKFGAQMVTDHSKANDELKALAATKNITLPPTPAEKHQQHIDELKAKKGAEFDKAYMSMMVNDHEEDVSKFEKEGSEGADADLKAFAAGKVATLKQHLEMAKGLNDKLK